MDCYLNVSLGWRKYLRKLLLDPGFVHLAVILFGMKKKSRSRMQANFRVLSWDKPLRKLKHTYIKVRLSVFSKYLTWIYS
jgi:hypothetical protein